MTRTFSHEEAKRERVPMLAGIVGPSGSGKTYSALRLATGMQQAVGGDIYVIDTEARRALHYADEFKFKHIDMMPPFSSLDYKAAIEYSVKQGARILVIDSMTHEHTGEGGFLEYQENEMIRMAGNDMKKRERVKFAAWIRPKRDRQKLIDTVLQLGVNGVFCFRAKEKTKPVPGKQPLQLGWQPIGGEEFIYEMVVSCLLPPNSGGVPEWNPAEKAERAILKLPNNLRDCFPPGQPLSEETGKLIAKWAAGGSQGAQEPSGEAQAEQPTQPSDDLKAALDGISGASGAAGLNAVMDLWKSHPWTDEERAKLREMATAKKAALA
jgi:ABC-type dipeptide/oligopeptide/nickel transport system ATPase subunit